MELRDYLAVFRFRWRVVLGTLLAALLTATIWTIQAPSLYVAKSSLFFSVTIGQSASELSSGFPFAQSLVRSYSRVATEPVVLTPVIQQLGLKLTTAQLARQVTARAPLDTVLIQISVSDSSPQRAAAIANAVGQNLISTVDRLAPRASAGATSPVTVTTVSPASAPTVPSSPRKKLNLLLALVIGALGGCVLALIRDALDTRGDGRGEVSRVTEAPVLGTIDVGDEPGALTRLIPQIPAVAAIPGPRRSLDAVEEQTKHLRTNFQRLRAEKSLRMVAFTSAIDDGATSPTVSQLALSLSQSGVRLLLVDADLRRPSLSERYVGDVSTGLSSVLSGITSWREAVFEPRGEVAPMSVIGAGPPLDDPSAMLDSTVLQELFDDFLTEYDLVLVKVPPVLRVAEGLVLSRLMDGVVIVVDERSIHTDPLAEELSALERAGAQLLGVVLTV